MRDHFHTAKTALQERFGDYLKAKNYKVDHRLKDVNKLYLLEKRYDLFLLDRDCTLHGYHAAAREPAFELTLEHLKGKSDLVSNSSYDEVRRIRDIFGDLMPVSMMVRMEASDHPILLRFVGGKLNAMEYHDDDGSFLHRTAELVGPDERLLSPVIHKFKKPNPEILTAVIQANVLEGRVRHDPRVLMVGDRYLTDIVAGNLADVDTALVRPFRPLTDKLELIAVRYALDLPLGTVMRNIHALSGSSYALPY